jgi:hypothetical protein
MHYGGHMLTSIGWKPGVQHSRYKLSHDMEMPGGVMNLDHRSTGEGEFCCLTAAYAAVHEALVWPLPATAFDFLGGALQ